MLELLLHKNLWLWIMKEAIQMSFKAAAVYSGPLPHPASQYLSFPLEHLIIPVESVTQGLLS